MASNTIAILHNIRSLHNVGSMFRTADGAGIKKLYLTGYTGFPPRPEISKTALGAEKFVKWEKHGHIGKLIDSLKKKSYLIVAIENPRRNIVCLPAETSVEEGYVPPKKYNKFHTKKPIAFIVGNEVKGLSKIILGKADVILEIPMRGQKESLNVSVAFGIIAYQITSKIAVLPTVPRICRESGKHL